MSFIPIDPTAWERVEYFEYFQSTTLYMTAQVDITLLYERLKRRGLRLYPALVYLAARVINQNPDFRYGCDERGRLGQWDVLHPLYTVPRKDRPGLFSMKQTVYSEHFSTFYEAFVRDYALAETCGRLVCDTGAPKNVCGVSIVPGLRFTGFSFGGGPKEDFTPFTLYGQFAREDNRLLLPVSGEFSHAVNDGLHITRFFEQLEATANRLLPE